MEDMYQRLSQWDEAARDALWERWLWDCDCNAPPIEQCYDLNEMHALGLLVCLGEYAHPGRLYEERLDAETVGGPEVVHLNADTPVSQFSLRELLDQIECLQLNWGPALGEWGPAQAREVLRALMSRLGEIAHHAYPISMDKQGVLDDTQHVTPLPESSLGVMSRKSLRQTLCVLLVMCRVCAIVERSQPIIIPPPEQRCSSKKGPAAVAVANTLRPHHVEASIDTFNSLQQMMSLAPGQRLAYRTQFAGMYNCVSQVIFFHHPRYARQAQRPVSGLAGSPMHMLPPITQLLPEIGIVYEDDSVLPGLTKKGSPSSSSLSEVSSSSSDWRWLVCCGAIFLLECASGQVWRATEMGALVAFFMERTGRTISAEEEDDSTTTTTTTITKKKRASGNDDEEEETETTVVVAPASSSLFITDNSHVVVLGTTSSSKRTPPLLLQSLAKGKKSFFLRLSAFVVVGGV